MSTDAVMTPAAKKEAKQLIHEQRMEEQKQAREAKAAQKEVNRAARAVAEAQAKEAKLESKKLKQEARAKMDAEHAVVRDEKARVAAIEKEEKAKANDALRAEHALVRQEKASRTVIVSVDLMSLDAHLATVCGPEIEKVDLPFWFKNSAEIPIIFNDAASAKKFSKKVQKNVSIKTSVRPQAGADTTAHFPLADFEAKERSVHESACQAALAKVGGVAFHRVVSDYCIVEFASASACTKFQASSFSVHGAVVEIKGGGPPRTRKATKGKKRSASITSATSPSPKKK